MSAFHKKGGRRSNERRGRGWGTIKKQAIVSSMILLVFFVMVIQLSLVPSNMNGRDSNNRLTIPMSPDLVFKAKGELEPRSNDMLWPMLLQEGNALRKESQDQNIVVNVMEVGMHRAIQCVEAARMGLQAYCVEPSPGSKDRIIEGIEKEPEEVKKNIRFFQMAAGSQSGVDLSFQSGGGTGDHAGPSLNIWKMEKTKETQTGMTEVTVKSVAIDDIIDNKVDPTNDYAGKGSEEKAHQQQLDKMFLLKVDTQGFEPSVFSGLTKSIEGHKIDFIITEYWPKGINLMNDAEGECVKPVEMLKLLAENGYTLYPKTNISHPKAPEDARMILNDPEKNWIRYDDIVEHCKFFFDVERKFPSDEYKMGYWTDILAVAPNARLPKVPLTDLGVLLQNNLKSPAEDNK